jgi:GntR family transcriptional regulator, transcriptional repressor for pyruvate dehydrogenase complex
MAAAQAFEPVRLESASEQAMNRLIGLVRSGELKPGDRLPTQRELPQMLGLSQTVIREAIRGLAAMGIVEIRHGQGVFVRSVSAEMLIEPETLFFLLEKEAFFQAIEVRRILEVEAVALAAERATPEDLAGLRDLLQQMNAAAKSADPLRYSAEFHMRLARASHNDVLAAMMQSFIRLIAQAATPIARAVPDASEQEYPQHYALYRAVASGDPEKARQQMRKHVATAERHLRATFLSLRK